MTLGEIIVQYVSPPLLGVVGLVVRGMVSSIIAFKRELRSELITLGARIGKLETRMVDLEGAVHQRTNSFRPPHGPGRY